MAAPALVAVLISALETWVGTLSTHPLNPNFLACQLENGLYLSVDAAGLWRQDPKVSADQAFVLSTNQNFLVGRRKASATAPAVTYTVGVVPFDGPAIP